MYLSGEEMLAEWKNVEVNNLAMTEMNRYLRMKPVKMTVPEVRPHKMYVNLMPSDIRWGHVTSMKPWQFVKHMVIENLKIIPQQLNGDMAKDPSYPFPTYVCNPDP
eukprot:GHVS01031764.1.p1 GENE.GHVS01031764.1~~GHVS01031764.1.p1  ORF type:complete len:106 (+),score=3.71 GHVS01031764.1:218-535(+)